MGFTNQYFIWILFPLLITIYYMFRKYVKVQNFVLEYIFLLNWSIETAIPKSGCGWCECSNFCFWLFGCWKTDRKCIRHELFSNKLNAIIVLSEKKDWLKMLLGFPMFHSRYYEIGKIRWCTNYKREKTFEQKGRRVFSQNNREMSRKRFADCSY